MLENLKQKPEEYRKKFALGVSGGVFLVMLFTWAFFKGYLGYSNPIIAENTDSQDNREISLASANLAKIPSSSEGSIVSDKKDSLNENPGTLSAILVEI